MDRESTEGRPESNRGGRGAGSSAQTPPFQPSQPQQPSQQQQPAPPQQSERVPTQQRSSDMIPREYLKILAVWSLVPSYAIAGGFLGYMADRWLATFPYLTSLGLLLALILAVRDMYRLRGAL